jgi:2OG-Fe(II) oxygenase superfamily
MPMARMAKKKLAMQVRTGGVTCALWGARKAAIESPYPIYFEEFLSSEECCDIRRELKFTLWRPSLIRKKQEDGAYRNVLSVPFRLSETATQDWFSDRLRSKLAQVEDRLNELIEFHPKCLESWQATTYARNGYLNYHLDSGYWEDHPAGDRLLTILIYLTTPQTGGGTHFRALDISIKARAGRLVVWNNLLPHGGADHRMLHSGEPLVEGEKITLVTWVRQKPCRNP